MLASSSTSDERAVPTRDAGISAVERRLAAVDGGRLHAPPRQLLVEDPAVDVVVVDDQDRQAGEQRPGGGRLASSAAMPSGGREVKGAAGPGSLSSQIRPPIIWTSVAEIVRPSPVPPNRRVVEPSAWLKASKIVACLSAGMPMPVSVTAKCSIEPVAGARVFATLDQDVALLGELDGVADEVDEHLPEPHRVADDAGRHVRLRCGR